MTTPSDELTPTSTFAKATTTGLWLPSLSSSAVYAICGCGIVPPHIRCASLGGNNLLKHSRTCGLELFRDHYTSDHTQRLWDSSHVLALGRTLEAAGMGNFVKEENSDNRSI